MKIELMKNLYLVGIVAVMFFLAYEFIFPLLVFAFALLFKVLIVLGCLALVVWFVYKHIARDSR